MRAEKPGRHQCEQKLAAASHRRNARRRWRSISVRNRQSTVGTGLDGHGKTLAKEPPPCVSTVRADQEGWPPRFWGHTEGDSFRQLARQRHLLAHGPRPQQVPFFLRRERPTAEKATAVSHDRGWYSRW